jgi:hypothetical protein
VVGSSNLVLNTAIGEELIGLWRDVCDMRWYSR